MNCVPIAQITLYATTKLHNQVYQGTVWGPPLWNCYFADARHVAVKEGFSDIFFADDLNLYKAFPDRVNIFHVFHMCFTNTFLTPKAS